MLVDSTKILNEKFTVYHRCDQGFLFQAPVVLQLVIAPLLDVADTWNCFVCHHCLLQFRACTESYIHLVSQHPPAWLDPQLMTSLHLLYSIHKIKHIQARSITNLHINRHQQRGNTISDSSIMLHQLPENGNGTLQHLIKQKTIWTWSNLDPV